MLSFQQELLHVIALGDTIATHSLHRFNTLLVNSNLDWHMGPDTITLASNQKDLRSVLLHEIGHSHYINHSLDPSELMYYSPELNSPYYRSITEDACLAGLHVSAFSSINTPKINCLGSPNMQIISEDDCQLFFTNGDENVTNFKAAKLYPSPANKELTLELEKSFSKTATIYIVNLIGQKMYVLKLASNSKFKTFDISTLRPGVYYLLINLPSNKTYIKKFIKI